MHMLFICGSLRQGSLNRMLMDVAMAQAGALGASTAEALIADIPLYSEDLETDPWPAPAKRFFDEVASADAVVIVSPEYNFSIPGGLKNAIDWASVNGNAWKNKAVALMGVSSGAIGSARGQMHLRQALLGTGPIWVVPQPQVCFGPGDEVFAPDGSLKDPAKADRVRILLQNLIETASKLK